MPLIETQRLLLRPVEMRDFDAVTALWSDPDVFNGFGRSSPRTPEETCALLEGMVHHWQEHHFGTFIAEEKDSREFIGYCELEVFQLKPVKQRRAKSQAFLGPNRSVELAYALLQRYWGQGYAAEAARAVVRFAFEVALLPEVFGATGENNLASQRVMMSAGMKLLPERNYYEHCPNFRIERSQYQPSDDFYRYRE